MCLVASVTFSSVSGFAQQPLARKSMESQLPRIIVNVEKVVVPVTVKDHKGRLVNDLKKTDFQILEDGVPQEISDFSTDPRALSAILLVDTAMSDRAERHLNETLRALTEMFSDFDELAVYTFEDRVEKLVAFGNDRDIAYKQLKKKVAVSGSTPSVPGGPSFSGRNPSINGRPIDAGPPPIIASTKPPTKRITDAIFFAALELKERPKDRRRVILVISDGNNTGKNENSYDDTLRLLLDHNIAVYGIADDLLPFVRHMDVFNVLPKFAADTGASMFYPFKQKSLEDIYSVLTEQFRNQYELTYTPKRHTDDSIYKSIEVGVDRSDVVVVAKQGYYSVSVVPLTSPQP